MFTRAKHGVHTSGSACVALVAACAIALTGCTPQQQQTTLQVVTEINQHLPEVVAAADTVAATVAALVPADAPLVGISDVAFDAAAKTLQALTASYLANPSASTFAQIQSAVGALEGQVNTATLQAVGIKNTAHQQAVIAALKGLLTIVTVVFALVAPTLSAAQLVDLRRQGAIHLARVRPYMDEQALRREAKAHDVDFDRGFRAATAFGL